MRSMLWLTLVLAVPALASEPPVGDMESRDPFAAYAERVPVAKPGALFVPPGEHRLVVKFVDRARVRLDEAGLWSETGVPVGSVDRLFAEKGLAPTFKPVVASPDAIVDEIEAEAARRTGVRPIDLRGMYEVVAPADRLPEIGASLLRLDVVEWAELEMLRPEPPSCSDIAPVSDDLTYEQGYTARLTGMNSDGARFLPASRGAGVRYADVEYAANPDHEDLCSVYVEPGVTIPSFVFNNSWDSHGTAVLGIMSAGDNGYGVTGLVPDAEGAIFPEWGASGPRRPTAITNAAAHVGEGGVLVLEMQTIQFGPSYGPAELSSSVWSAVRNATDAGRVVVAAAGNGNQDLDAPAYAPYRARGDSGAILVGAGRSGASRDKLSFSTHGSRVDVQAWGENVATTGYGFLATFGGDKNQRYTWSFSGTSSATPLVAGVSVILQGYAQEMYGETLTSAELRELLVKSGIPQTGPGGRIGPRPDALQAIRHLDARYGVFCESDYNRDGSVDLTDFGTFGRAFGATASSSFYNPVVDFNNDGQINLTDFGRFGTQFGRTSGDCD